MDLRSLFKVGIVRFSLGLVDSSLIFFAEKSQVSCFYVMCRDYKKYLTFLDLKIIVPFDRC